MKRWRWALPLCALLASCTFNSADDDDDDGAGGNQTGGKAGSKGTGGTKNSGGSSSANGGAADGGFSNGGSNGTTGGSSSTTGGSTTGGSSAGTDNGGSSSGGSATSCVEEGRMVGMTAAHNAARDAEGQSIPALTWDCDIAATAQAYAEKLRDEQGCGLVHSSGDYGENLYASASTDASANSAVNDVLDAWVSEVACYNYGANSCTANGDCDACGHYTQVVWANTTRVGCGVAECPTAQEGFYWEVWVCNYDPPGNFNGERPY